MSFRDLALGFTLLFVGAACSTAAYRYVAEEGKPGNQERSEVLFPVSGGKVQVDSEGVVEVEPGHGAGRVSAARLKLLVSNESGKSAWQLDGHDQTLAFPNQGALPPTFVDKDTAIPVVSIPPGELRTFELYYELPKGESGAQDLQSYSFHWKITVDGQAIEKTTLFARRPVRGMPVGPYADPYPPPGPWGGPYWYGGSGYWVPHSAPALPYRAR